MPGLEEAQSLLTYVSCGLPMAFKPQGLDAEGQGSR